MINVPSGFASQARRLGLWARSWVAWSLTLLAIPLLSLSSTAAAKVDAGTLADLGTVASAHADPRRVTVWVPSSYRPDGPKHAVLYMHDGQNLFDPETGFGGMEWKLDETLEHLIRQGQVRPTIVVAIWNTPKRLREYVPAKAFSHLPEQYTDRVRGVYGGDPLSDGYLKFIAEELKPRIDASYNVNVDRENTVIMGSSMGGLISLYAINEYPHLFGGAGMISTHWPMMVPSEGQDLSDTDYETVSSAFERYLAPALPDPATHRLYFDHGSETLDAIYARYQQRIDRIVADRGFTAGDNWISRNFPGHAHNEVSWASRAEVPLRFLLPPVK